MSAISKDVFEGIAGGLLKFPQVKGNVRHLFYPGLYVRELSAPARTLVIGRIHKQADVNILAKGVVRLLRDDGTYCELTAPQIFLGTPGRKVAYVLEDMVWMNVYTTDETDVEALEAKYLEPSPALEDHQRLLGGPDGDYEAMLSDIGLTADQVRAQSEIDIDLMPFPIGEYKVKIGRSGIEGRGLIATADIEKDEFICHARIGYCRTPAGRYTNHSGDPNAEMVGVGDNIYLLALRHIEGCLGGLDGEEVTVDYRQSYALKMRLLK